MTQPDYDVTGEIPPDATVAPTAVAPSATVKTKKRRSPSLKPEQILIAMEALGGTATLDDLSQHMYGMSDKASKGRIRHHLYNMAEDGAVTATGSTHSRKFHLNRSNAKVTMGVGDLFEVVGRIGDSLAVRSMDTKQIYTLTEVKA